MSRLIDAVYYDTFGKSLSVKQMEPIVQRLSEIANDRSKIDTKASIDASVLLSHIYETGLAGPANEVKALEFLKLATGAI